MSSTPRADRQSHSDRVTRFLASAGGTPVFVIVLFALLGLILLGVIGIWVAEGIAIQLGKVVDQEDALLAFAFVCVLLAVFLLLAPVCIYVMVGQGKRIEVIKGYYSPEMIARYFDQFWAGLDGFVDLIDRWKQRAVLTADRRKSLDDELKVKFDQLLTTDFGFGIYMVPMVLLTAVALIVMYFGFLGGLSLAKGLIEAGGKVSNMPNPMSIPLFGLKLDLVSVAAIFGAYTFVTSNSITPKYQSTFHPSDLSWYALRLIIAVPLGQAIAMLSLDKGTTTGNAVAPGAWGAFLAFVISMFSLDSIMKYLTAAANRVTGNQGGSAAERDDLVVKLPGVDEEAARRLTTEGVSTIAELVSVDPIRISIRSGLSFDFILALVDASILWTYVGGKIAIVREFGFKGASNILIYNKLVAERSQLPKFAASLSARDAERAAAETLAQKALTASQLARRDADAKQAELADQQAKLDELAQRLQDSSLADANKIVLQNEKQQLEQALAALKRDADRCQEQLGEAKRAYDDANSKLGEAAKAVDAASADLIAACGTTDTLLTDLADKAGMKASGLKNIVEQLVRDEYADFIWRLMGVTPALPDER